MTAGLRVADLSVAYGDRVVLSHVDLDIAGGASVAVIGPNGSGKSTLLSAIAGLVHAQGHVEVDRASLALVLQSTDVDRSLPITVLEVVRMARYPHRGMFGRLRSSDHEIVREAMRRVAVDDLARRQFHELSGGQRQRVLVAQGLAQEADVLLLDEPVTGLDIVSKEVILDVVADERSAGRTVIMTTHSLEEAAACDLVVLLAGRMVAAGPPGDVLAEAHLAEAFGGRVLRLDSGQLLLDDPHHLAGT
ncbi:MAG TPA: metal ABC transporter ATP-binding protein [Acidimicrobiales bacterium]|nr:metal ABC transporter ATP-binding protein [Acidimicrobiales bacterium]